MATDPICSKWITPRIWFDEVERIGMQRCTPIGYAINSIGGDFWALGILAASRDPGLSRIQRIRWHFLPGRCFGY